MEMFVVFNIPPFCSLDSFASHLFRIFVHLNTIKEQGLSRDPRSPSAVFALFSDVLVSLPEFDFDTIVDMALNCQTGYRFVGC